MLEIGLWELSLLAVLCLLVVGPERLPGLLRTFGTWTGRAKLMMMKVKAEFDRELDDNDKKS